MPIDLDHLRKLDDDATPGAWESFRVHCDTLSIWTEQDSLRLNNCVAMDLTQEGDAALIVYLRNHVPEIIEAMEELERVRAQNTRFREALMHISKTTDDPWLAQWAFRVIDGSAELRRVRDGS